MTILRGTMAALALVSFIGATATAAQEARPRGKAAAHHIKKRTPAVSQAGTTTSRGGSESWMDRASANGNGASGGGGGGM